LAARFSAAFSRSSAAAGACISTAVTFAAFRAICSAKPPA